MGRAGLRKLEKYRQLYLEQDEYLTLTLLDPRFGLSIVQHMGLLEQARKITLDGEVLLSDKRESEDTMTQLQKIQNEVSARKNYSKLVVPSPRKSYERLYKTWFQYF